MIDTKPEGEEFALSSTATARYIETNNGTIYINRPARGDEWVDLTGTIKESNVRKTLLLIKQAGGLEKYERNKSGAYQDRTSAFKDLSSKQTSGHRMSHTAPGKNSVNLTSNERSNEITVNTTTDVRETIDLLAVITQDSPELITVYRSCHKSVSEILAGDWVAILPGYAANHGRRYDNGDSHILCKEVSPSEVFTDGNSIHEFGYSPISHMIDKPLIDGINELISEYGTALMPKQLSRKIIDKTNAVFGMKLDSHSQDRLTEHIDTYTSKAMNGLLDILGEEISRNKISSEIYGERSLDIDEPEMGDPEIRQQSRISFK
tara:strand:- start:869 stop:1828 length:960 start_codon:yes stop_codon:yes gene_type:complete